MRAGALRHRITLQNFTQIQLPSGQRMQKWQDVATVWAEVKHISGRELMASGAVFSEATVRIWLRYRADITTANRIFYQGDNASGQFFNIVAVIPDPQHTRLELLCKGGLPNG
ncbi:phage head closure protein [Xenorhabdus japonica]|uniref:Phage head-tail adaptor, putative, SPP1 family n=1 Tax=Xenorhabdus japonica TaxID=53341 RepID=A0A1I5E6S8_9GAMM|nr:phage head closure protein [Xenorhabdus japonica]SFO07298.1 phage head-tail adaptor, putative, SPP1 family [Xenorhabdus japonica]